MSIVCHGVVVANDDVDFRLDQYVDQGRRPRILGQELVPSPGGSS
jgi:hypothetical protein